VIIDDTHDPGLRSWVPGADGHAVFPIQNLPHGVFVPGGQQAPRGGVAVGDHILDLAAALRAGLFDAQSRPVARAAAQPTLNAFLSLGPGPRRVLRRALSHLLSTAAPPRPDLLHRAADCTLHLPARIGDYTDFYAGIHHATNVGKLFRPDVPLLPNYKHVPIAYHGRASSVLASGAQVARPHGQRKPASQDAPDFGPSRTLDHELELGIWIGAGNALGQPIPISQAADHIAGYCLLNDLSARDIQGFEYQPLGPFLGKNFGTVISPWIITPEALAPFRAPQAARPNADPAPLPYLWDEADQAGGALALVLDVWLERPGRAPEKLSTADARLLYWTPAQMVAHHSCNGCDLRPGDLFGSGTISGPTPESFGSLLEITEGGRKPMRLADGSTRRFLEDGDTVMLRARAEAAGYATIGFGDCRATILEGDTP
jgi:fumarylacetoacetase